MDTVLGLFKGRRQSDENWNRFKANVGETFERRGGAHTGFSEHIDTILNWTKLSLTINETLKWHSSLYENRKSLHWKLTVEEHYIKAINNNLIFFSYHSTTVRDLYFEYSSYNFI